MTLKILVADDSTTIQKIVGMAFENEDAVVEGIGDGQEAFDKIPEFKPDIVLADVDMPGIDGFQLSKKIKENPDLANIKVLLLASDLEVRRDPQRGIVLDPGLLDGAVELAPLPGEPDPLTDP